jgi:transposase
VTQQSCHGCGGKLIEQRVAFAYVTDLPPLPQPRVTQYRVGVCRCTSCGRQVRGEHPDLAPDQYGATAHRLGTRAKAVAHILHYQVGIPVRKLPLVLELLAGLELTQGGITQDALRRAKGVLARSTRSCGLGFGSPQWSTPTTPVGRWAGRAPT